MREKKGVHQIAFIKCVFFLLVIVNCLILRADAGIVTMTQKTVFMQKGKKVSLQLKQTDGQAVWESTNEDVVSVSKKGKLTAKKPGFSVITAKTIGKEYQCKVVVENVRLNRRCGSLLKGNTLSLKVKGCKHKVRWKSMNKSIASVNANGKVTGKKTGQTTVYAIVHHRKYSCKITVNDFGINPDPSELIVMKKPVIYLYPKEETQVTVRFSDPGKLLCSYPKYKDEWKVLAYPDGTLENLENGRSLYSLYYESRLDTAYRVEKEGFVVKGEDTADFLEEKLAVLGLTEREAEEFIIYYLPVLEANPYNYIRFATNGEIEANMPFSVSPRPDTVIRICMSYKPLKEEIQVTPQKLLPTEREGFTLVEWGGTEIP